MLGVGVPGEAAGAGVGWGRDQATKPAGYAAGTNVDLFSKDSEEGPAVGKASFAIVSS